MTEAERMNAERMVAESMVADRMLTEAESINQWVLAVGYEGVLRQLAQDARARAKKRPGLEATHDLLDLARKLDALVRDTLFLRDTFQSDHLP